MKTRRNVLAWLVRLGAGVFGMLVLGIPRMMALAAEAAKRILPKGTDPGTLSNQNPARLDTRHLEVMDLKDFDTMGDVSAPYDAGTWRLEVEGSALETPLKLTLDQVTALQAIEREVLLICPGFFSNHGRWKGVTLTRLLEFAPIKSRIKSTPHSVSIIGRSAHGDRREIFTFEEVQRDGLFLAYQVNGHPLPRKHGFPLRLVAEGHMGSGWIKYVYKLEFIEKTN